MKLRRLLQSGFPAVANRGWQQISRSFDRLAVSGGTPHPQARPVFNSLTPHLGSAPPSLANGAGVRAPAGVLPERYLEDAVGRFFAGVRGEEAPALFAADLAEQRRQIIATADAVCQGRFDLLGYQSLHFGDPVDWHLDPVAGRRAPLIHWSRIDALDTQSIGDSKVIWELNRHQWLVTLGQAYCFTGDERYAQAFAASLRSWMKANPPGLGINWSSSLEAALRIISWCWALFLFRRSPVLSSTLFADILGGIRAHASHVERYLSHFFSPNTHLTGEALGLFYAGVVFPDLRGAQRWRRLGRRILLQQLSKQVHEDGVYFEQATCYQRYTVEIYLHFLLLCARNAIPVPAEVGERVRRMLDFLLCLRSPDGSVPQIGDADGGWLLPFVRREPGDMRGVFAVAATVFERGDYAWAAQRPAPEVAWLFGPAQGKVFDALKERVPAAPASQLFDEGGYAVMRSGWLPQAHHLIFDVGPLGCRFSGGHGHADLLSIQCSAFGRRQLIDPGTYTYTANEAWRNYFRSTKAHNTVIVDGLSQAYPRGPFSWWKRPSARLRSWSSNEYYDLADADHDAYARLPDPVRHRRRILFVKPRYWIVVDDLYGKEVHHIDLHFQFATGKVSLGADGWAYACPGDGRGLLIRSLARPEFRAEISEGAVTPIEGWESPDFGCRRPAPYLKYTASTGLPLRIVTLLYPINTAVCPPPKVSHTVTDESTRVFFEREGETILVDDDRILFV